MVQTLADNAGIIAGARSADMSASPVAIHEGARAHAMGEPMPPPVARALEEAIAPDHVH